MSAPRAFFGSGGLGALLFLGGLGAAAVYVQRQSVNPDVASARKSVTVEAAEAEAENAPEAGTPQSTWRNQLDLSALTLAGLDEATAAGAEREKTAPDPNRARLVQETADGHRILTTLDPVMQDTALQIFRNREVPYAAAVVLDVQDGNAVLTFAGHSTMDPDVDPLDVLTSAWAPAASTFKLVTATSLLEHEKASPSTRVCFSGGLHGIEDAALRDDPAKDTRCATLSAAVAHSHNLVIAKLAHRHLSPGELQSTARKLLFGRDLGFEFPVERSPAHIPDDPTDRAKIAAGFWNVDLSPVHAAVVASVFARQGKLQSPHFVAEVRAPDGGDLTPTPSAAESALDRPIAMRVGKMMEGTTTTGTARKSFHDERGQPYVPGVAVAGKTGSLTGRRAPGLNYNWFVGFAPADDPEIAFAVVLANEPQWQIKAHYAARRLVQTYVARRGAIAEHRKARLTATGVAMPAPEPAPQAEQAKPSPAAPSASATRVRHLPSVTDPEPLPPTPGPAPSPSPAPKG